MKNKTRVHFELSHRLVFLVAAVFLSLLLVWLFVAWTAHASAQIPAQLVSSSRTQTSPLETIHIEFFYPGDDRASASTAADSFANLLSQETDLDIVASIHFCEDKILKHLGSGQTDLSPLSAVAYVLGRDTYNIEARLVNGRFGAYGYRSQIIVQTASGYTDLWDLQDKRVAFSDPLSRSGYQAPYLLISETTGMIPTTFFSEVIFTGSHPQVIREVYTGTVNSGGTYEGALASMTGEYPDVYDVVTVLTYTDYISQDPWVFRRGLDSTVVQTLTNGIITVAATLEGGTALQTILGFTLDPGIVTTQDSAYDMTRDLVNVFGGQMAVCNDVQLPIVLRDED